MCAAINKKAKNENILWAKILIVVALLLLMRRQPRHDGQGFPALLRLEWLGRAFGGGCGAGAGAGVSDWH
jgi:hypothetical protein